MKETLKFYKAIIVCDDTIHTFGIYDTTKQGAREQALSYMIKNCSNEVCHINSIKVKKIMKLKKTLDKPKAK